MDTAPLRGAWPDQLGRAQLLPASSECHLLCARHCWGQRAEPDLAGPRRGKGAEVGLAGSLSLAHLPASVPFVHAGAVGAVTDVERHPAHRRRHHGVHAHQCCQTVGRKGDIRPREEQVWTGRRGRGLLGTGGGGVRMCTPLSAKEEDGEHHTKNADGAQSLHPFTICLSSHSSVCPSNTG